MEQKQNPAVLLRRAVAQLRGLRRAEEWRAYLAVAALCLAVAGLAALRPALAPEPAAAVRGQRHILLQDEAGAARLRKAAAPRAALPTAPAARASAEPAGDWYYDAVHQDWRYKKN